MTKKTATRLSLELTEGDGPIAGRLTDGTWEVDFSGWLALVAALEGARTERGATAIGFHGDARLVERDPVSSRRAKVLDPDAT